jgi:hypothetical protein
MNKNDLAHNIRNPILGIELEIKNIMKSIKRMEKHLSRMDDAKLRAIKKWAKECTLSLNEVLKD